MDSEEIYYKDNLAATHRGVVQSMKAMALAGWHSEGMLKKHSEQKGVAWLMRNMMDDIPVNTRGKTVHSKSMQFKKGVDGKTNWEISEVRDGKKETKKGEGLPPESVMSEIEPEIDVVKQLLGAVGGQNGISSAMDMTTDSPLTLSC